MSIKYSSFDKFLRVLLLSSLSAHLAHAQNESAINLPLLKLDYSLQALRSDAPISPEPTYLPQTLAVKSVSPPIASGSVARKENIKTGWFAESKAWLGKIWDEGREEIYLSGYAYHDVNTYTPEKRAELNNYAIGGGYGRVITSDRGNDHALYALAFLDSHKNIQPNVGYYYQAIWGEKIRFGAGATVLVASRPDIFGGIPFPAIMPLFSVGTKNTSVMFVPLPKLSNSENANNGNVLFIFGKFAYK